jgi:hypothetical protein
MKIDQKAFRDLHNFPHVFCGMINAAISTAWMNLDNYLLAWAALTIGAGLHRRSRARFRRLQGGGFSFRLAAISGRSEARFRLDSHRSQRFAH